MCTVRDLFICIIWYIIDYGDIMKTYTICGSMRFEEEMKHTAFILETEYGFNILQCTYNTENKNISDIQKLNLVNSHYAKIDISDGIYVMDIDGYMGESVKKEIEYARNHNKEIIYHSKFKG